MSDEIDLCVAKRLRALIGKPFMFVIEKTSEDANDRRLFEMIRLVILYDNTAKSNCWRKVTRERYRRAVDSMTELLRLNIRKHYPGFATWQVTPTGSTKFLDLQANRQLAFLITLAL